MAIACDECGAVLDSDNPDCVSNRIEFLVGNVKFQLILARDGVWNTGAICKKCLKKLVLEAVK